MRLTIGMHIFKPKYRYSIIDPCLPNEQTGFGHNKFTVDQVTRLTQNIKQAFSDKKAEPVRGELGVRFTRAPV